MASLFMETTTISETKTVAEIQDLLAKRGATSVQIEYDAGKITGVAFLFKVGEQKIPFKLPCRWQALEALFKKSGKRPKRDDTYESWARRVAWRQILRWVEAQIALIETGMAKTEEVFLPYAIIVQPDGVERTMHEWIAEKQFLTLGPAT